MGVGGGGEGGCYCFSEDVRSDQIASVCVTVSGG